MKKVLNVVAWCTGTHTVVLDKNQQGVGSNKLTSIFELYVHSCQRRYRRITSFHIFSRVHINNNRAACLCVPCGRFLTFPLQKLRRCHCCQLPAVYSSTWCQEVIESVSLFSFFPHFHWFPLFCHSSLLGLVLRDALDLPVLSGRLPALHMLRKQSITPTRSENTEVKWMYCCERSHINFPDIDWTKIQRNICVDQPKFGLKNFSIQSVFQANVTYDYSQKQPVGKCNIDPLVVFWTLDLFFSQTYLVSLIRSTYMQGLLKVDR